MDRLSNVIEIRDMGISFFSLESTKGEMPSPII